MRTLLLASALLAGSGLAQAQADYTLQIDSTLTSFTWSGTTSVGDINENPATFTLTGTTVMSLDTGGAPVGAGTFVGGDAAVTPDLHGTIPGPFGSTLASIDLTNAHVRLISSPFVVDGAGNFSANVVVEMLSGTITLNSLLGNSVTDLAGAVSNPTVAAGNIGLAGPNYHLTVPVNGVFPFSDPGTGITATLTINGTLHADYAWTAPASFCPGAVNSTGGSATLSASGTPSLGTGDLVLHCNGLPANQPGIIFYGPNQVSLPFGNGTRCVGGTLVRLSPLNSGPGGQISQPIVNGVAPISLAVGDVRHFQFWYRDPAAGGAFFNLSSAVTVEMAP
ncbi:MAG: hypothetical protein H6828_08615 [Planctomycetes bacterium]|nr:hypothetical protein [Planctomycetota bacterium]